MCVGERRRITVPPSLAFGAQGLVGPGLGQGQGLVGQGQGQGKVTTIPPNTSLVIDVRLLSLNGIVV